MTKSRTHKSAGSSDLFVSGGKVNLDAKLSKAALILEYAFEYGVNFKEREIQIFGGISKSQFKKIDAALTELEADSRKTVTIKISSPGGDVYQALAIIGRMERSTCHIVTEGYGHVMSAATLILAAGDTRRMSKRGFFMHHEAASDISGKLSELKTWVRQLDVEERLWSQWMEEFTGTPMKFWLKTGVGKDAYFSADKLLKLGVVDEIF